MQISNNTLTLLKHLTTLNPGIRIEPGNVVICNSTLGNTIVSAIIEETFPNEFITSDLSRFLSVSSLIDNPEYHFYEDYVEITSADGAQQSKFYYGFVDTVNQQNRIPKPPVDVAYKFVITDDVLQKIRKACQVIDVNDLIITSEGDMLKIMVADNKISSSNNFSFDIGTFKREDTATKTKFTLDIKTLKLISGIDYSVEISDKGLAVFTAENSVFENLVFYIAVLAD